jgi:hypothetical protein
MACKQIISILKSRPNTSISYTWIGDLKPFTELGYYINENYIADFPYIIKDREIVPYLDCELCREKS